MGSSGVAAFAATPSKPVRTRNRIVVVIFMVPIVLHPLGFETYGIVVRGQKPRVSFSYFD
jgi:hypothetical protein